MNPELKEKEKESVDATVVASLFTAFTTLLIVLVFIILYR